MRIIVVVLGILFANAQPASSQENYSVNHTHNGTTTQVCAGETCSSTRRVEHVSGLAAVLAAKDISASVDGLNTVLVATIEKQTETIKSLNNTLEETYRLRLNAIEQNLLLRLEGLSNSSQISEEAKAQLKEDILAEVKAAFHPDQ